ncbi:TMEM165/GDT1 family protein [Sphingomonas sp. AOB5]|uniref:TMEM165/GDT1 family protein n=1 Tax=Sphingomonas sp. AOB5 TaxID=3034017 RepID=UPI0023F95D86|nr:TMEM165/GDT1 family protein [Sphingomonas sp. AOB5]MDF7776856.1 TMEM165/GDT1 family protein [Sphingomonas sp. AOB5]
MEALVPAFIAALLTQLGERPAILTAILADRYGRPLTVAFAAGLAHAALNALAALGSIAIAPTLTPNAQALFLAVALVIGGLGALFPAKTPDRLESWGLGSLFTAFLGVFSLALGSQTQFFTLAFAVRGEPWFAFAGAAAGAFAVAFVAAVMGEAMWQRIPFRPFRWLVSALFLVAGIVIGAGALRLI